MTAPPYSKDLVNRRNNGQHPTEVFISVGWPTASLLRFIEKSCFARGAALIAAPEACTYDFRALRGLSCCVWFESVEDEARAHEIASQIMKHDPVRLYELNTVTGQTTFHRIATEWQVEA